jgi:uncharacterized damage-inducible protein DinB
MTSMPSAPLDSLFRHLRWADEEVLTALRSAPPHASALELFAHVVGAEETWLARLEQRAPRAPVWPDLSLDEAARLATTVHASLAEWLERADDAALEAEMAYTNSAGQRFTTRALDIVMHVMLHGAYHRGQIALLIRQAGAVPAPTDYVAFVRGAPTATRSSSR